MDLLKGFLSRADDSVAAQTPATPTLPASTENLLDARFRDALPHIRFPSKDAEEKEPADED
jgi:hypothetical protein